MTWINLAFVLAFTSANHWIIVASLRCAQYQESVSKSCHNISKCEVYEVCKKHLPNCFAIYKIMDGKVKLNMAKCMECEPSSDRECIMKSFTETAVAPVVYFACCCSESECNKNIVFNQSLASLPKSPIAVTTPASATAPTTIPAPESKETSIYIYLVPTIIMFILMIVLLLYFCKWYRQKSPSNDQVRFLEGGTVELTKYPVQMENVISRGQFGNVWKGVYRDQTVAIKGVNMQGVKLWETERSMFESYNLRNENVINFVGSEKKTENNRIEYLIITEFYDNGSVADFLCQNVINLKILLRQILSMAKGLAYLHTEDKSMSPPKPLICHCDFKSRNVLVKKDLSCCISDFGVAYTFFKGTVNKEPKMQVGTPRYMSPEVLDGVTSNLEDSRLAVDLYALALVMWEIMSRCHCTDVPVDAYQAPYQINVGPKPSVQDMREIVVVKKIRPPLKTAWERHAILGEICNTIQECWDEDNEARLSAHCVLERLQRINMNFERSSLYDKIEDVDLSLDENVDGIDTETPLLSSNGTSGSSSGTSEISARKKCLDTVALV